MNANQLDDRFTYIAVCACVKGWQAVVNGNPHDRGTDLELSEIVSCKKTNWIFDANAVENEHKMAENNDSYRIDFANGKFFIVPGYWMIPILK